MVQLNFPNPFLFLKEYIRKKGGIAKVLKNLLFGFFPLLNWVPRYKFLRDFKWDLISGITVAVTAIPQGMAYATIVGLPPIYGLYCAFVPPIIYFVFGTSRELTVGPTAVMSLFTASIFKNSNFPPDQLITHILLVSFLVGCVQLALGIFRLGFLSNFLSHPVISGFTSSAAIMIAVGQLRSVFGIPSHSKVEPPTYLEIYDFFKEIKEFNLWTLLIGLGTILIIVILRISPKTRVIPSALIVVILFTVISYFCKLDKHGVSVIGEIPEGLPKARVITFGTTSEVLNVFPSAILIALIGIMEAMSIGKTFALRARYDLDINQEMVALGAANLIGAFFSAYPSTGSFARTAVNARVGCKSGFSNLINAVVILFALLFLTKLLHYLPKSVLGGIVMTAVINLFDYEEVKFLFFASKLDLLVWLITFISIFFAGIEIGLVVGIGAGIFFVMWRMSDPRIQVVKHVPRRSEMDSMIIDESINLIRVRQSLFFLNVSTFKEAVNHVIRENSPKSILIEMSCCNDIDSTGIHSLLELFEICKEKSIELNFVGVQDSVMKILNHSGIQKKIGIEKFLSSPERFTDEEDRKEEFPNENQPLIQNV